MQALTDIIDETVKTMPDPSPIADQILKDENNARSATPNSATVEGSPFGSFSGTEKQQPIERDKNGAIFDPSIHAVDSDGNPRLNKDGSFARKRGRKSGSSTCPAGTSTRRAASLEAGRASAEAVFAMGMALGGEEWAPIVKPEYGINEPQQMTIAFAQYYEATGRTDLPPWAGLAIAVGSYAAMRVRLPQTQSRLQKFGAWLKSKISPLIFKRK